MPSHRFYIRRFYRVGALALVTFFLLNNALSRAYVKMFEDSLLPMLSDSQRTKRASLRARVVHTTASLCESQPKDFSLPAFNGTYAIMTPAGECESQKRADNIIKWYKDKKHNVQYLLTYDADTIGSHSGDDITPAITFSKLSTKSGNTNSKPVSLSRLNDKTSNALISLTNGKAPTEVYVSILPDQFANLPDQSKLFAMTCSLIAWIFVIPAVSFMITKWLFRKSLTIDIGWRGAMIIYEGDEDDEIVAQRKLFTTEKVLELPEVTFQCSSCDSGDENSLSSSSCDVENQSSSFANTTCSICIEDFENGEHLRVLPCGHIFHTDCIMPWLTTRNANCPMCKQSFEEDEEDKKTS